MARINRTVLVLFSLSSPFLLRSMYRRFPPFYIHPQSPVKIGEEYLCKKEERRVDKWNVGMGQKCAPFGRESPWPIHDLVRRNMEE
jgi:hypothetical protein